MISTYFDYNDYENPLKTYVDDQDGLGMNTEFSVYLDVKVQQNKAFLADDLFYNFDFEEKTYYNVKNRIYRTMSKEQLNNGLLVIFVALDKESEEYERVVYTFLDMFGFLGGLFDFMFFSGFIFIQFFVENSYLNSAFSKLYQVKVNEYESNQSIKFSTLNEKVDEDFKKSNQTDFCKEEMHNSTYHKISTCSTNSAYKTQDLTFIKNFKHSLKNRRKYSFNLCDNIKNI